MKTYLETEDTEVQIDLVPLIDVVFCVLCVFILGTVGLTRPEGINLNLPKAETAVPQIGPTLKVEVGVLGELRINDQPVTDTQLTQQIAQYLQAQPLGVVVLSADGGATYEQVIAVLDLLRSVGGDRVALETSSKDSITPGQPSLQDPSILPVPPLDNLDPGQPVPGQTVPGQPAPSQQYLANQHLAKQCPISKCLFSLVSSP
ncbi:MAG: biopolymer transporter ExbD [Acaryochloridaceae cyanobacterium SU_2_1]|nr:biopolymer transporter ExbD [Acaryochloridaceae cyanobacterium SU_2_1]